VVVAHRPRGESGEDVPSRSEIVGLSLMFAGGLFALLDVAIRALIPRVSLLWEITPGGLVMVGGLILLWTTAVQVTRQSRRVEIRVSECLTGALLGLSIRYLLLLMQTQYSRLILGVHSEYVIFLQRAFGERAQWFWICLVGVAILPQLYWLPAARNRAVPRVLIATTLMVLEAGLFAFPLI
jgi:hypothetical protein